MKNKIITSMIVTATLVVPSYAYAEEVVEDPREYPNVDTLPPPSEEMVSEDPWTDSSLDPKPNDLDIDPSSQDEPETWAVVDEDGNTLNVISCDIDYCGSGWIPTAYDGFAPVEWARVVLQSKRDPETGENNGGHWGQYNFPSGVWTEEREDGGTYKISQEYGEQPVCFLNCPPPQTYKPVEESVEPVEGTEDNLYNESISSTQSEPETLDARSFNTSPHITKKNVSFIKKFPSRNKIKNGRVWIILTKNNEKIVLKTRVAKVGKTKIKFSSEYLDWNIFVNYTLNNNKRISKQVFFV